MKEWKTIQDEGREKPPNKKEKKRNYAVVNATGVHEKPL